MELGSLADCESDEVSATPNVDMQAGRVSAQTN